MLPGQIRIQQAKRLIRNELKKSHSEGEAESITGLILEHAGYPPSRYLSEPELVLDKGITMQINEIVSEIHRGRPIQYILGYTWFCDLKLRVDPSVLIPRPETEEMVGLIRDSSEAVPPRILDLGSGSGAIALALKNDFPGSEVVGADISEKALEVAAGNARNLGLEVTWIQDNMLQPFALQSLGKFELIVSNPPYIPESERVTLEPHVAGHEPAQALFVPDTDPLVFYRSIGSLCETLLAPSGVLWVEIHSLMGERILDLFRKAGLSDAKLFRDLHGRDRFISARQPEK